MVGNARRGVSSQVPQAATANGIVAVPSKVFSQPNLSGDPTHGFSKLLR